MSGVTTAHSSATRYLCAAAHLDESFTTSVFEEVLHKPYRAVAPSYGIDLVPVVRHCLAARRRQLTRDSLLTGALLVSLVVAPGPTTTFGITILLIFLFWRALRRALERRFAAALGYLLASFLITLIAVSAALGRYLFSGVLGSLTGGYAGGSLDTLPQSDLTAGPATSGLGTAVLLLIVMWAVVAGERLAAQHMLVNTLSNRRYNPQDAPEAPSSYSDRLAYISGAQWGNVTIYAETLTRTPFVGSGSVQEAWSFAIPLERSTGSLDGTTAPDGPLSSEAMYEDLRRTLLGLGTPDAAEGERLPGLSIEDRVFLSGLLPPDHPAVRATGGRPVTLVDEQDVRAVLRSPRGSARHYHSVRVASWEGEVAVTVFVHFGIQAGTLYTEFVATVLPPIKPTYHAVDALHRLDGGAVALAAAKALPQLPLAIAMAPVHLVSAGAAAVQRRLRAWREGRVIGSHLAYDYGATTSVRELGAVPKDTPPEDIYFQYLDATHHIRIVERRTVASVAAVLRRYGYSSAEFDQRVSMVINQGTMINGGTINGSAFAAGASARAKTTNNNAPAAPSVQPSRN